MSFDLKLWRVENDSLDEVDKSKLNLEERLETWLEKDISILSDDLLIIGRQVKTGFGGLIDLLCMDPKGNLVIVELKRNKTPRDVVAQTLDYASWVNDLSHEAVTETANDYLEKQKIILKEAFLEKFGEEIPEVLNESHSILIVASEINSTVQRVIEYLAAHGVRINAATFHYFQQNTKDEYLARAYLIEPEVNIKTPPVSKRLPDLSLEQLQAQVKENGVDELYQKALTLEDIFGSKKPTRSTLTFNATINGKRRSIFNLQPITTTRF